MAWFKRTKKGINTLTEDKKDVPKGLWYKSPTGKIVDAEELEKNFYVSPEDGYHVRIGSKEYFEILFDNNEFKELDAKMTSKDPLSFVDTKKYSDRLKDAIDKTGLKDAVRNLFQQRFTELAPIAGTEQQLQTLPKRNLQLFS